MLPPLFSSQSPQESGSTEIIESDDSSITSATSLHKELQIPNSWPPSMQCIGQESDEERKRSLVPSIRNVLPQPKPTQGVMYQGC